MSKRVHTNQQVVTLAAHFDLSKEEQDDLASRPAAELDEAISNLLTFGENAALCWGADGEWIVYNEADEDCVSISEGEDGDDPMQGESTCPEYDDWAAKRARIE